MIRVCKVMLDCVINFSLWSGFQLTEKLQIQDMSVEFGDEMKSDDEFLPWWFVHTELAALKSACRSQELFYSKYKACVLQNVMLNLSCCTLSFVRINYHRHMVSFTLTALEGST